MRYHPLLVWTLTSGRNPAQGHYQAGSLTGAVASIVGLSDGNVRSNIWLYAGTSVSAIHYFRNFSVTR